MAPPRQYQSPHEQLMGLLREQRQHGVPFERAWDQAMRPGKPLVLANATAPPDGVVLWPTDSRDRIAWKGALNGLKDEIRRAYELRPATSRERAVVILVGVLGDRESDGIPARQPVPSAA